MSKKEKINKNLDQEAKTDPETILEEGMLPPPEERTPEEEISMLEKQLQELNDRYLRLAAEYDNYRKRTQKEKDSIYPEAVATTVANFLPFSDNLQRAIASECKDSEFKKGVEMIMNTLNDVMANLHVETVATVGESFNPDFHNAVAHDQSDEFEENTIMEVYQQGYRIGDRVLRYAMVHVAN